MRSFVTLLLCCLAVGSLAASTLRTGRDADDDSEEVFPAEFRSTALVDLTEERSPRQLIPLPLKLLLTAKVVAALALVATGTIRPGNMSLPIELPIQLPVDFPLQLPEEWQQLQSLVGSLSEFLVDLSTILELGSRRDTMAADATQALQDLDKLLDEGAVTAVAKLQGGAKGELSFAQTRDADGNRTGNDVTIISGTLSGLTPGVHKLQVTLKGDISNDCGNAGEPYSDESDGIFVANDRGNALVVIRAAKAPLRGTDTILGRSVVITSEADPDTTEACGVIVHPSS